MNKHFNPAISEEKFAAWLDGMLPADEMSQISSIVDANMDYQSLMGILESIDADVSNQPVSMFDVHCNALNVQHEIEYPALDTLQLTPIDVDFSNGVFPNLMPDYLFRDDSNDLEMNDELLNLNLDDSANV